MGGTARVLMLVTTVTAAGMVASCASDHTSRARGQQEANTGVVETVTPPSTGEQMPRDYAGLHNVVAYHEGFYSGSAPEGRAGFETLAGMGVKTIISVDGAEPEVGVAKAMGLRYIHLPIGYNGFDEQRKLELVRATRDAMRDGPVYIHCHHGKHRSAGAAGTIGASLDWGTPEQMVARMKVSGAAPNYKGLYSCTANATVLGAAVIDAVPARFPAVAPARGFVKQMVEIDEVTELLKRIEKAEWRTPKDHPDLVPVAEAGRLADLLRTASKDSRVKQEPSGFAALLNESQRRAQLLEDLLAAGASKERISEQFGLVAASCKDCHAKFRD